jgi:hypothetical protein
MVALPAPGRHRARASFPRTPAGAAQQIGVALRSDAPLAQWPMHLMRGRLEACLQWRKAHAAQWRATRRPPQTRVATDAFVPRSAIQGFVWCGMSRRRPVTPEVAGRARRSRMKRGRKPRPGALPFWNVRGTQRRQPVVNAGQARTGRAAQRATNGDWRERAAKHGARLSRWRSRLRVPSLLFQSLLEGGFRLVTSTRGAATQRLRAGPWDCESPAATRKVQPAARLPGHRRAPELATNSGRSGLCVATCAQGPDSASTEGQPQSQHHT